MTLTTCIICRHAYMIGQVASGIWGGKIRHVGPACYRCEQVLLSAPGAMHMDVRMLRQIQALALQLEAEAHRTLAGFIVPPHNFRRWRFYPKEKAT